MSLPSLVSKLHIAINTGNHARMKATIKKMKRMNAVYGLNAFDEFGVTPLMSAIMNRNKNFVKILLKSGANVRASSAAECRPLCLALRIAMKERDMDYLKTMCSYGADINADGCDPPLYAVVAKDNLSSLVEYLISQGADPNASNETCQTALMMASQCGHVNYIHTLLAIGANLHMSDSFGFTALHYAAKTGMEQAIEVLAEYGADVSGVCLDEEATGRTALMAASWKGHLNAIHMLIKCGADIEAKDDWERTALSHAVVEEQSEVIKVLLDYGALQTVTHEGRLLHIAAINLSQPCVEVLLGHSSTEVNALDEEGNTALHVVVTCEEVEVDGIVLTLLKGGADVHARDCEGRTPIMLAAKVSVIQLLLDAGANVNAKDYTDSTALHTAVLWDRPVPLICKLIAAGADLTAIDEDGLTPVNVASQEGHCFLESLLLRAARD